MKSLSEKAAQNLAAIRKKKPLIHNITNYVVMNYTANALLAMGASPVMAHASNEVEEMVSIAGALVLNIGIGTLTDDWIASMIKAGKKASESKTPIILDPVGNTYHTRSCRIWRNIIQNNRYKKNYPRNPRQRHSRECIRDFITTKGRFKNQGG